MKINYFKSSSRGSANYGWLISKFSYSFGEYYDEKRMGFGALRVVNDDKILGTYGFDMHPHKNMEIISIPLKGELSHKDSEGNAFTIKPNDVQVMSAGFGITHSEFNHSKKEGEFFQIWINPKEKNIKPRYDKKTFSPKLFKNKLKIVASGTNYKDALYIHQDASVGLSELSKSKKIIVELKPKMGCFIMCVFGKIMVGENILTKRDVVEVSETKKVIISSKIKSKILVITVPL